MLKRATIALSNYPACLCAQEMFSSNAAPRVTHVHHYWRSVETFYRSAVITFFAMLGEIQTDRLNFLADTQTNDGLDDEGNNGRSNH